MAFVGIPNLRELSFINARLRVMPPVNTLKSSLEKLIIRFNHISSASRSYFIGFKKLCVLDLQDNELKQIPDITPLQHTIIKVYSNSNKIQSISGILIGTTYPLLKSIGLSGNDIKTFNADMLLFWPLLTFLDLSDNCIVKLPTNYPNISNNNCSAQKQETIALDFGKNPIHCDETVEGVITGRRRKNSTQFGGGSIEIMNIAVTICASPAYLRGRDLETLGKWKSENWSSTNLNKSVSKNRERDIQRIPLFHDLTINNG